MLRRIFRVAVVFVVLLALGAAVLILLGRPRLENARSDVNAAWGGLSRSLDARYHALDKTSQTVESVDPAKDDRTIYRQIENSLNRWGVVRRDPELGPPAANRIEALANRLRAVVLGSPKLRANPVAVNAFAGFDAAVAPADEVSAYNNAVQDYQDLREDTITGIVARFLGDEARIMYEGPAATA